MNMRKFLGILVAILLCMSFGGCSGSSSGSSDTSSSNSSNSSDTSTDSVSSSIDTAPYAVSVAETASTYDAADVVDNVLFGAAITIDFTTNTAQLAGDATIYAITAGGVTPVTGVTIAQTTYGITITSTVSANVAYTLTGTLNGTLTVKSSSPYQLSLNGVTINATAGPALDLESTQKVFIVAAAGTTNTLTDASARSMTMKAALYGKGPMVFSGDGSLSVTGSYKHGIFCNDYIRVRGGTLTVAVSTRDGIRAVNGFIFDDGNLTINATGITTDDESKGIKVEGSESTSGAGKGFIVINGGYITITSAGKAITAGWDIDEDASTAATTDDPDPYVIVNNGVLSLTTTVTPYEYTSNGTTVSCSPEGIEGKSRLTINSGYLTINTTDDCLNAGDALTINGGYLSCTASHNDAIDCNGNLTIAGGNIVAIGAGAPEGSFDYDDDDPATTFAFTISGGTFVGIGGNTARPNSCTQNVVVLGGLTSGSTMALKANDGTVVFAYTIPQSYATMILSSPDITTGTTYTLYTGGTAAADYTFNGLFLDDLSYSGGTAGGSFTVSSRLTQIGGQFF